MLNIFVGLTASQICTGILADNHASIFWIKSECGLYPATKSTISPRHSQEIVLVARHGFQDSGARHFSAKHSSGIAIEMSQSVEPRAAGCSWTWSHASQLESTTHKSSHFSYLRFDPFKAELWTSSHLQRHALQPLFKQFAWPQGSTSNTFFFIERMPSCPK